MGRKKIEVPKPVKVPEKKSKYRCTIGGQHRDFDTQKEAREMALKVLNTGQVFYLTLEEIK